MAGKDNNITASALQWQYDVIDIDLWNYFSHD